MIDGRIVIVIVIGVNILDLRVIDFMKLFATRSVKS
jgi:hypothetical protein